MTCPILAFEVVDLGCPSEEHQFEHGTTRYMATPTLLENKMPLLQPSSAFLTPSIVPLVKRLSPSRPSPCPRHYSMAFGYYAASALCPACWHSRTPLPGKVVSEFPHSQRICSSTP